jgi:hypothetical protein
VRSREEIYQDMLHNINPLREVNISLSLAEFMAIISAMQLAAQHPQAGKLSGVEGIRIGLINSLVTGEPATKEWFELTEKSLEDRRASSHPDVVNMGKLIKTGFDIDEEIFILRAKDKLSTLAIEHYKTLAINEGLSKEFVLGIDQHLKRMFDWQEMNPEKVRMPD